MTTRPLILVPLLLLLAAPPARGDDTIRRREEARDAPLATPEGLFLHYCGPCHGEDGKGLGQYWSTDVDPSPTDLTATRFSMEHLIATVRDGTASHGKSAYCPPWGATLPSRSIDRIARHAFSLSGATESTETGPAEPEGREGPPFPWKLSGLILIEVAVGVVILRRPRRRKGPPGPAEEHPAPTTPEPTAPKPLSRGNDFLRIKPSDEWPGSRGPSGSGGGDGTES